jgi:glycosyltransferase involved in cell wall biosynthesis
MGSAQIAIVYVSWSVLPSHVANSVQVIRMANALSETGGADVTLIARRARNDRRPVKTIAKACGLDPRISLTLLSSWRPLAGLQLMTFGFERKSKTDAIDVVYSRVLPIFLRRISACRRIFEMHEPPGATWRFKPAVFNRVVRARALTDLVYISGGLRRIVEFEHAAVLHPSDINHHVLHSGGASPTTYCAEPTDGPFTIAYAGKPDKLDRNLIATLARSDPTLKVNIYGSHADQKDWLADIPNIELFGWIEPADLPARLREAHVLVAPYTDVPAAEWFSPVKIFDYAAAGRPMLISDHAPIREIFPDGSIGRLLPQGDVESWRTAILELRSDPARRSEMGRAALIFASTYSFSTRARRICAMARKVRQR